MPNRAKKPCRKSGCSGLVTEGYCERHAKHAKKSWSKPSYLGAQGSTTERGYGYQWQKRRLLVLNEQPLCQIAQICVQRLGHVALSNCVDHIIPIAAGGNDEYENLQGACSDCNEHKARTSDKQMVAEYQQSKPA